MTNFFAALDDSDDEHEPQVQKKQPEKKKTEKSTKKVAVSAPVKSESQQRHSRSHHNDRNLKSGRGGGSRSERERQPPRDGKRAYERRSGTGRGKEIKKSGGGGRNWGSDKNDARQAEGMVFEEKENENIDIEGAVGEQTGESAGEDGAPEAQENGDAAEAEPEKEEEEDKTMTYEEYLAQKAEQRAESDAFKPVEMRELENEFAGLVGKKGRKEEEAEAFLKMGTGKALRKKGSGEKKEKEKLVPNFRVQDANAPMRRSNRRDGGRGGRGYDRRGDRKRTGQVDVADMSSFPSL